MRDVRRRGTPGRLRAFIGDRFGMLVLVAAPIAIVVAVIAGTALSMYRYYTVINTDLPTYQAMRRVAAISYNVPQVLWNSLLASFDRDAVPETSALPTVRLRLEPGAIEKLAGNLPHSAKAQYYRGELMYPDGSWRRIDFRFRGRSPWHWHPDKPSLRLRLRRSSPLDLNRHINLVNPEDRLMVSNYIGDELARRLGVLSFDTRMVRVFVNGLFYGVYQSTLREDESFLRRQRRVPGPLYVGDNLQDPWQPENFAVEGETDVLRGRDPIGEMVAAVNAPVGPERYERLWGILSRDHYARWLAATNLTASVHTDNFHNHLYYFDPRMGRLEPAIVDPNGHGQFHYALGRKQFSQGFEPDPTIPLNEPREPLKDAALRDPRLYHARNLALYAAINGPASTAAQHRFLDETFATIDADVHADRRKAALRGTFAGNYRVPYSNGQYEAEKKQLYDWIAGREAFIRSELGRTNVAVDMAAPDERGRTVFLVEVSGHAAVTFDASALGAPVAADVQMNGSYARPAKGTEILYPGLYENTGEPHRFVTVYRIPPHFLEPATQSYLFRADDGDVAQLADKLRHAFKNAVTGEALVSDVTRNARIDPAAVDYNTTSVHAWKFPADPSGIVTLGPGEVVLDRDLEIASTQRLRIVAGTTLRLAPGVSIISRGRVDVAGTADRPVTAARLDPLAAWGAIVLLGPDANGSTIEHLHASGGSVGGPPFASVSGMLAVYDVADVRIADTKLSANSLSDDLLHLLYSDFTVERLQLAECFADCVDVDFGRGTFADIDIAGAGNDGIDLMTSEVSFAGLRFRSLGDKGISTGEMSKVQARDVEISDAAEGIAVKDRSEFNLVEGRLNDNAIAIAVYRKNWRYGGPGRFNGRRIAFTGNEVSASVEEGGELILHDQPLPPRVFGDGRMVALRGNGS